jgi:hypothetical protein
MRPSQSEMLSATVLGDPDMKEGKSGLAAGRDSIAFGTEENNDYPTSWKLGIITLALCLSVFCMSLVGRSLTIKALLIRCQYIRKLTRHRTTQSLRLLFLASQMTFELPTTWVGTDLPIFSPPAPHSCSTASSTPFTPLNGSTCSRCSFLRLGRSFVALRQTRRLL